MSLQQPSYTPQASAARISGRIRLSLQVSESGAVSSVSLLQGLGYGLDQAAISAARRARFTPATRCGKAISASFTVTMRFSTP
ncbi:MAG: energy transducer TonB [Polyangiaceae bacterium]